LIRYVHGKEKERFRVPIPVIGEAFLKINSKKTTDVKKDSFKLLEKLIDNKTIELIGFGKSSDVFMHAKNLMTAFQSDYRQDSLDPMDALIITDALIDTECRKIYTEDVTIRFNKELHYMVNEIRSAIYPSCGPIEFSQF